MLERETAHSPHRHVLLFWSSHEVLFVFFYHIASGKEIFCFSDLCEPFRASLIFALNQDWKFLFNSFLGTCQ
jgi:hypothetical protein